MLKPSVVIAMNKSSICGYQRPSFNLFVPPIHNLMQSRPPYENGKEQIQNSTQPGGGPNVAHISNKP